MYGIYIHIPFCISKCKYCDFASFPDKLDFRDDYITKILDDIKGASPIDADTIYIGGGTPSVLSEDNLSRLMYGIREYVRADKNTEFTVEVNPGTVTVSKARIMKEYGVNRISMGAQSFADNELKALGRIHSAEDTIRTYRLLQEEGFSNISLDLMYAIPHQTMASLRLSLDKILELAPGHISCYGLKIEEGTPFHAMLEQGLIKECHEDMFADMYTYIASRLCENGYSHYEISNFATKGRESKHNLKYWQGGDYLGFGAAASSKVGNRRYTNPQTLDGYMNNAPLSEDYHMDIMEQMREFIILGLRVINSGVDKKKFRQLFGDEADKVFASAINRVKDYVINTPTTLKLRKEVLLVSNSIMCEFME